MVNQQDGKLTNQIHELTPDTLPSADVTIAVEYSSLNYKDGLAVTGAGKIIRQFPMIPGIDLAGTVEHSHCGAWNAGDRVILTGWGIGERYPGGYTQRTRAKSEWLVKVPDALSTKQAMAIGTAGLTSMLCVMALERAGVAPGPGPVVVTGAAGGVGSIAVAILAKLGYKVTASTGRAETHDYLRELGAAEVIERSVLGEATKRPMEQERWAAAVDSVGGVTLGNLVKTMQYGGSIAACGLAGGADLATTVFPFILRGVNLLGVDSVFAKMSRRQEAWGRLAADLPLDLLDKMVTTVALNAVDHYSKEIVAGRVRGRVVVDVNG